MTALLRRIETLVPRRAEPFGGKVKYLAALARAGFPVPAAYGLAAEASARCYEAVLEPEEQPRALLAAPSMPSAAALAVIAEKVRRAELPAEITTLLLDAFHGLRRSGARTVAVRSSGLHEDSAEASAAGLHASVLAVDSAEQMIDAARECYASLFTPRAIDYLRRIATAVDASMGLLIQAMVPAEVGGVIFTANPLTNDHGELVIDAVWGLGVGAVDGTITPDTYRIDKRTRAPRDRLIGEKQTRLVIEGSKVVAREVPPLEREREALEPRMLERLIGLGLAIEQHFGDPRDVEWAIVGNEVYVLQARPITTLGAMGRAGVSATRRKREAPTVDRAHIVWSNVNVGEALPGVATPFTWSVLSAFSQTGFRRAFGALGCSVPRDAELVGNFRGRVYLNLSEIVSIASQVPGLDPRTLLSLGGGGEVERLTHIVKGKRRATFWLKMPLSVARLTREGWAFAHRMAAYEAELKAERTRMKSVSFRILTPTALDQTLRDVRSLLEHSGSVMLSVYGNLLAEIVLLRGALRLIAREDAGRLERALLSGLEDVESAAPGILLWRVAEIARKDDAARAKILSGEVGALRVESLPDGPTRAALEDLLARHGYRGLREAEVYEPRWSEDPSLLFAALRIHLGGPELDAGAEPFEERQRHARELAEAELEAKVPAPMRPVVKALVEAVQGNMRLREKLRAYVTEVLGFFRAVVLEASRRVYAREPEAGKDAAFFLTVDEVHRVLRGEMRTVGMVVRSRRAQYERDRALADPPSTFVGFPPPVVADPRRADTLHGLAASSGRVEGTARVLMSAAEASSLRPGEILVAPYADVGWSPLFLAVGALVTDLGGPLSHAAIVAREHGVPAVVNLKSATKIIRTGDRLLVDGDAGTVHIVSRAEPE